MLKNKIKQGVILGIQQKILFNEPKISTKLGTVFKQRIVGHRAEGIFAR